MPPKRDSQKQQINCPSADWSLHHPTIEQPSSGHSAAPNMKGCHPILCGICRDEFIFSHVRMSSSRMTNRVLMKGQYSCGANHPAWHGTQPYYG